MSDLSRREFLLSLATLPALGLRLPQLVQAATATATQTDANQPNIILLVYDTFSAPHISLQGYERETTPHIARLAERATVFHNHYAGGNFTSPGTASLLTGLYPWNHRSIHNYGHVLDSLSSNNLFGLLPFAVPAFLMIGVWPLIMGITMFLPESDRYSTSKRRLESRIATLFGGRVAEEIVFGPEYVTTGASNDIERATEIARSMVTKWGLSDKLGPQTYAEDEGEVFLGRSVTQHKQVSDVTAHVIDEEIRVLIDSNFQRAKGILERDIEILHKMAEALIKYETIDDSQIADIMQGREPKPPADWEDPHPGSPPDVRPRPTRGGEGDAPSGRPAPQH